MSDRTAESKGHAASAWSKIRRRGLIGALPLLAMGLFVIGGCTDEETVFVERPLFEEPPDTVFQFLGYFDAAEKMTVCGNCHVGQQSEWEGTAHTEAWDGLQASGHAAAFCEGCHTVSQFGNALEDSAGYELVQDERYEDVQCESCHGSGFEHVENPDATAPFASAAVGEGLTNGCGECHEGTHHPFVTEWTESPHAGVIGFAAAREECAACHRGQATIEAWGENADYVEKESSEHLAVVCVVCHDPHDARHDGQLRFPVATTSIEQHLCARCHDRRTAPDPASSHGLEPHSPESALLVGDAGWFPPDAEIDQGEIRGTHGSAANDRLCATCHMPSFEVADDSTGDFVFQATGHLFRPIPCTDEQGIPLPFEDDCALTVEARSYTSCTSSGTGLSCHGDADAAFSALSAATTRIQDRADDLLSQLEQVDPNLEDAGGFIDPEDPTFTIAEGAFFNHALANFGSAQFGTNTVIGSAVHNPFLVEALLIASIQAVEDEYGVMPAGASPDKDWDAELQAVLRKAGK